MYNFWMNNENQFESLTKWSKNSHLMQKKCSVLSLGQGLFNIETNINYNDDDKFKLSNCDKRKILRKIYLMFIYKTKSG